MTRLSALQGQSFDVAIIGGGIVGCGVARDAARRGLRVALFEKRDFASGTTAASTRIVHGGLRYLETADLRLVRLDLQERETLLRIAPHLVKPLEFVIPFRGLGAFTRLKLRAGLALYDALASGSSLPRHRMRNGDAAYHDARVDSPERLCVENVVDAAAHGAQAFNYCEVTGVLRDGGAVAGVRVHDVLTGEQAEIRARVTVNASGPWFERVAGLVTPALPGRIRTTKGIHLVCPPLTDRAEIHFSKLDGRMMFAIPRQGLTWLGTTDTDYPGDPADAVATAEDVKYVVHSLRHAFPELTSNHALYTTAGVRALVMQGGSASSVSRMHRIVDGALTGTPGIVSIMGGKITGYRAIAEEATDVACRALRHDRRCTTGEERLPGGSGTRPSGTDRIGAYLYDVYGSRAAGVTSLAASQPPLARPLAPAYPDIAAQVVFSVKHEFCATVSDFLRRRSLLGATADQGWMAAPVVAEIMGAELGWPAERRTREIDGYARDIERTQAFLGGSRSGITGLRHDR